MRNKYSDRFERTIKESAELMTIKELTGFANKHFKYKMTTDKMRSYLYKRGIKYKGYNKNKAHANNISPIGCEYTKPDGMVLVKVRQPSTWEYKQRYIYQKYYNIVLPTETMVIFLDGDRTNFSIDNLMAVSTPEYNYIRNKGLVSNDREVTKTAILSARLNYKTKEKENENN